MGGGARSNRVIGNFVGVNATGTQRVGSTYNGVRINESVGNTVGGTNASERNIIGGNGWGMTITGSSAYGNRVLGNHIGVDPSGNVAVRNDVGVVIGEGAHSNSIGGNVISGNMGEGISIISGSHDNQVLVIRQVTACFTANQLTKRTV